MPQLGMAQDTGILVNWLKAPGDAVAADDILFEVETDKSTMEVEAGRAGLSGRDSGRGGRGRSGGRPRRHHLRGMKPEAPVARSVKTVAPPPPRRSSPRRRMRPEPKRHRHRRPLLPRPQPPPPLRGASSRRPRRGGWHANRDSTSTASSRRATRNPSTLRTSTCCAPCPPARRPVRPAKRRAV
jgi:hypothetical protein